MNHRKQNYKHDKLGWVYTAEDYLFDLITRNILLGWVSEQKNLGSTMNFLSFLLLNSKLYPILSDS